MVIKDILLFLEAGQACEARLNLATALARAHDAVLTALCACQAPATDAADCYAMGPEGVGDVLTRRSAAIAQSLAPTEKAFQAAVADGAIEAHWTCAAPDETPLQLAGRARLYDLAIAARGDRGGHRLAELVAVTSGTPCLVTAEGSRAPASFDRVLVAWNGSREAKRALDDGLVFMKGAEHVGLLVVEPSPGEFAPAEAVLRHLARHGIEASLERVNKGREDAGSVLLKQCERFGADLLIMGAYGHSRTAELVLGGATRTILANAPLPVLMSH